ncbi:hypothetical protein [Mesorhizobium sp. M4B.F.Ca.ET.017.02.2.1]|uniref:hypothetical protein n=1 Tax=Mesorhizobium sp. M4B.F.Ca.ET.017.02.2.1 TaxID=2496649 RepID=UPI000FCA4F62|nr:hypothetical protein [Mesorhizobium sp. M4B.F.Ca.ET.017.02.2.1]RVD30178.1 hypothetical protein EN738_07255 [Mesorhizobium sp. M4B.F.Ca.ET.017.02.2.1]
MAEIDAASILFPNDVPSKPAQAPDWYQVQRSAAEQRLSGGTHDKTNDAAATMFPGERKADASAPAGEKTDVAAMLFKDDAARKDVDFERVVGGELDQVTLDAMKDGDVERASALKAATAALSEDFRAAGTSPDEISQAFQIVRESADSLSPPTREQIEEGFAASMAELAASGVTEADLGIARQFIKDLEIVSPGVVASLERHGAGNDPRLVRAAIKEAKRRGYR